MNVDHFARLIDNWCWRVAALQERTSESSLPQEQLAAAAFEELYTALEELQVAEEELRLQNEELQSTRSLAQAERQHYQELFEFAPDGYLVTDANGMIREANRAACTLLNVSQKFLVGKPLYLFVAEPERREFYSQLTWRLRQVNRVHDWETRLSPRNSEPFNASLSVSTVRDQEGQPVTLHVCVRDITERQRTKELLHQQTEQYL